MTKNKIEYISVLQGFAILLVVVGHCWLLKQSYIWHFCYGIHMRLFFFLSGGLFYITKINKETAWRTIVKEKAKRLLIPYIFFINFAYVLKIFLSGVVKNDIPFSFKTYIWGFLFPTESACKEMWFIAALFLMFLVQPVYLIFLKNKKRSVSLLLLLIFLSICEDDYIGSGLFNCHGCLRYVVYFWMGICFYKYNLIHKLDHAWGGGMLVAYFILCSFRQEIPFIAAMVGIVGIVFLARKVCSLQNVHILTSFRDYSFQIFLLGIYPQMFVELFLGKRFSGSSVVVDFLLIMGSVILALYIPVLISKVCKRYFEWANVILGLK